MRTVLVLLLTLLLVGCAMPRHTVGLDSVLADKLGGSRKASVDYRCTRGAHRGDSIAFVENTLAAVRSARQNPRFGFIEFDVQYSSDGTVMAFHDKRLLRVFGSTDKVGSTPYAELRELTGGEIATYQEIMDAAKGKAVNVEIKSQGDADEDRRLVDFVVADVKARKIRKRVLISSISDDVITYVKEQYPEMATGRVFWIKASTYLHLDFLTESLYRQIGESRADYLMLHVSNLHNLEDLLRLKPKGKTIVFWDFDDTMYVVHKDLSDRNWGESGLKTFIDEARYTAWRWFAKGPDR